MRRTLLSLLLLLGSFITTLASGAVLTISPQSWSATLNTSGTTSQTFTVTNHIKKTLPISISTTITAGSLSQTSNTCSNGVSSNGTCTVAYTYTAPSSVPSQNPAIAGINFSYGGRDNIPTVVGSFTVNQAYTITPTAGSNGSISPSTAQSVTSGDSITFTATPNSGYAVSGWLLDGASYSACGTSTTCQLTNVTASHTIEVDFAASTTTISANTADLLFTFNGNGTARSTLTITNTGSAAANAIAPSSLPTGITLATNNCSSGLAASASCTMIFTTTATPDSTQTLSILANNTNTLSIPIAPLSLTVYSTPNSPSPSNASLMLVGSCTVPELLMVTNNAATAVTTITVDASALTGVTASASNCPASLAQNRICFISLTAGSATTGNGNLLLGWGGTTALGSVVVGNEVSDPTLLPSVGDNLTSSGSANYVFATNTSCNLVKAVASVDQSSSIPWTTTNTNTTDATDTTNGGQGNTVKIVQYEDGLGESRSAYAAGLCVALTENSYTNWYLPSGDSSELNQMYTNRAAIGMASTGVYWSSTESEADSAWGQDFGGGTQAQIGKLSDFQVRCSRALTY